MRCLPEYRNWKAGWPNPMIGCFRVVPRMEPIPGDQAVSQNHRSRALSRCDDYGAGVPTITPTSAFNLAYNDYLNGKYDLAVAGFQRFVKDFPGTSLTPNAYYWLGESYYQQKDYVRAIQSFEISHG